nr:unnamed protein product [uncultured archaeal virus]
MIYGFFGSIPGCPHQRGSHALRGNGKTLCLTFVGYLDHLSGRDVISNYKTSFSELISTERIAEMVIYEDIRDTTILLSELQLYMNSLGVNTKQLRNFVGSVIGQSRKRNTDIHYDTQRYTDVHPRIRVQTDRAFLPRKFHADGNPCQLDRCDKKHFIYLYQHDPYMEHPIVKLRADKFGVLYDTNEIVALIKD